MKAFSSVLFQLLTETAYLCGNEKNGTNIVEILAGAFGLGFL